MRLEVEFNELNSTLSANFIQTKCSFETDFIQTKCLFETDFGEVILVKKDDVYTGDYNVIPRVYPQILLTKDKSMVDDVTIEIIPLVKVTNPSNGYTAVIG